MGALPEVASVRGELRSGTAPGLDVAALAVLASADRQELLRRRRLADSVAAAVAEAGFARHFVPRRFGGSAAGFGELLEAAAGIAETCASTAWCATLFAAHGRLAAYLPEAGQRDLWGAGPNVRIAASIVPPQGEAIAEADGWRLTGSWAFASGVDHAEWVLLASRTPGEGEAGHRVFAVPRGQVTVADTWRTTGLRGTGSNAVRARDVFVPARRSFSFADLGRVDQGAARCHRVPYALVGSLMFALPALGAARGALLDWRAAMSLKRRPDGTSAAAGSGARRVMARSAALVHSAELLLRGATHRADHAEATALVVAENRRDAALAVELCAEAVDGLWRGLGAGGLAEDDPVLLRRNDIAAIASHAALGFDSAADAYAQALFTVPGPRGAAQ
ncbi:oxidoreductase [Streptomyces sp. NPDC051684]|uniref:oxidoreductase n=1 Tax=Streptomyces sp. NPDC051684 TaxID=3365670 RepID=UPI0037A3F4CE